MPRFLPLLFCLTLSSGCGEEGDNAASAVSSGTDTPLVVLSDTPRTAAAEDSVPVFEQVMRDSGLIDVQTLDSRIRVELKYSTTDNFLHTDVYGGLTRAYLRPAGAKKLAKAQKILSKKKPGYTLVVYDAARPRRVQYHMWNILDIPHKVDYLADPAKGSVHNYGMAVDLSIMDDMGRPLDMGTPFDYFGELARPEMEQQFLAEGKLTESQLKNRKLLRNVMTQAGFQPIKTEWWHFTAVPSRKVASLYRMIE